jgi:hypothetical protein
LRHPLELERKRSSGVTPIVADARACFVAGAIAPREVAKRRLRSSPVSAAAPALLGETDRLEARRIG